MMTATILRALPDSTFQRTGIHTESGKVSLSEMIDKYIHHLSHHLTFVAKKRAVLDRSSRQQSDPPAAMP